MSTFTVKYFDTYEYIKRSKELGVPELAAEFQVKQIEQAIETVYKEMDHKRKDLATRGDLKLEIEKVRAEIEKVRAEIEKSKNQMLLWIFAMSTGFSTFIIGIIAKGFHWL